VNIWRGREDDNMRDKDVLFSWGREMKLCKERNREGDNMHEIDKQY
jgi:hypothetical protein